MDDNIQVVTVRTDLIVCIYGVIPRKGTVRPLLRKLKFKNYGKALQYAQNFEDEQRKPVRNK